MLQLILPTASDSITIKDEEKLARKFLKVLKQRFKLIKDPWINKYVNGVGQRVAAAFPPSPFPYHFYVIVADDFNAFAIPAGHIFIYSGLLEVMQSEDELAGLLAHEISHVHCRHISQKIERSPKIGLATMAGIAAGILLGMSDAGGAVGNALTVGSLAASQSMSLAFSRADERQADQTGIRYVMAAGYDGNQTVTVMKRLREKHWFGPEQIPTYLMTHPDVDNRIIYLEAWLSEHNMRLNPERINPKAFKRTRSRLIALYGDQSTNIKHFKTALKKQPHDAMAQYGYGLALARNGDRKQAVIFLQKALARNAFDPNILEDIGRVYFLDGQYQKALQTLEGALSLSPKSVLIHFYLGRTYLKLKKYGLAIQTLEKLLAIHPSYDQVHYFLGDAYGQDQKMGLAHYHLGLYFLALCR